MKKQFLLLLLSLFITSIIFGQATINCFPSSGDYNTGTTNGTTFTETSLIRTQSDNFEAGWARFDISEIPEGATIQSVELNIYIAIDNNAYFRAVSLESDPLTLTAAEVFSEITTSSITYAEWSGADFPDPDWWISDLGPVAVTDITENFENGDGWFSVGIYEYETFDGYTITCDGWSETNQPFISVTYLLAGAPLPAFDPNPVDEAMNIEPEIDLTWTFGDNTETYDLLFGTDFPPTTLVVENETSGVTGSYDPGMLEFQTTYYWQVVSKNSTAEIETPGPIWTFTIKCDAWAVPIFEGFEEVTAPEIPYCWFSIVDSWSIYPTVQTNDWGGIDGSQSLYMYNSEDPEATLILATPQIEDGISGKYANFYSNGEANLSVGTMSDPTDASTYTEYTSFVLTSNYLEYEVFFNDYIGDDEYIAFKHESTDWYVSLYFDSLLIDIAPTCPKPANLYFESSTLYTAIVGWTENGSATMWNLEHGLKGFAPTGVPTISSNTNPTEITGLAPSSQYEFYVQADCGDGDLSLWVGPFEFVTECESFYVPIFQNFDLVTTPDIPICWSKIEESVNGYASVYTYGYDALSDPNCLNMYNSDEPAPTLLLISPQINDPIYGLWLNFYAWSYSSSISIGTMSDPADASTYTEYTTFSIASGYLDYLEYEVLFDTYSGSDEYIVIKGVFQYTYENLYIDNIVIDYPPTCPKPENLYVTGQTTNSASLGWTEMGEASMWNIEYDTAGFIPTGIGNIVAGSNPFDISGLTSGTVYEYYVQADCGDGDLSYWVGPLKFKTTCEATSVPYFEGFEDAILLEPPICVIVENVNGDDNYWYSANDNAYEGENILRVNWNGTLSMDDWFYSAPLLLSADTTYIVQFFYTSNSSSYVEKLEVKWGEYPSSLAMTSEPIFKDTLISYAYTYHEGIGYFTPPADGIYFVGWHGYSAPDQFNLYVDNILIDVAPTCLKPAGLHATETSTNSATLQWTENGDATMWNIEYGPEGFTPTGIPNAFADSNPYELMGLDLATDYDAYIQADCGDDDVSWWQGTATFSTFCEAATVPLLENFDDVTAPEIPLCWSKLVESTSVWASIESDQWDSYSPPNSIRMGNDNDVFASTILISPILTDPINALWVNFFAAGNEWSPAEGIIIGTISNPLDASTFTAVDTIYITGAIFEEYEVFFSNYTGTDHFIAFKAKYSMMYEVCFIDEVTIDHPPTCPKPSDLYANGATTNSIMLGWQENGEAIQWNIEHGPPGFTPTGTPNAFADSNPFEITGLDDASLYEYYVQANCGAGDLSYWVGPYIFQTLCFPASLPYEEGFEDVVVPLVPPCIMVENTNIDDVNWESSMMNPNSGNYHMSIGWNGSVAMNDWFFSAPLELLGGQTYNVVFYYSNSSDWYFEKLELLWGTEPNSDAMLNGPFWNDDFIQYNQVYQEAVTSFTPDTNGIYFVGWHGMSDANQDFIYIDDIFIEWDNSLVVLATATPDEICEGESSQLNGSAVGGSGSYSYSWTSDPVGFTSTDPDPIVTPIETTDYILEVNDGMVSIFDTITVTVIPLPGVPQMPTGLTYICANWDNTTYSTSGGTNTTSYNWVIDPVDAGEISGASSSVTIIWEEDFLGEASLKVAGINNYCEGDFSTDLMITRYLPDVALIPFDTACIGWNVFELSGGTPAGGIYSGTGVVDGWFDPAVAGVGTHIITYTYQDIALCENYAEQDLVVDVCTGINIPDGMSIGIVPNPNNGLFKVFIKAQITEKVNIKVVNNQGITVFEDLNIELTDKYSTEVNLEQYAKGLYYLYIHTHDATHVEKIIVK